MKRALLIVGLAFGMNAGAAFAQHEDMPGHDNMPGGHENMPGHGHHAKPKKDKKEGDADKKQPPKADDQKHEGHDQP